MKKHIPSAITIVIVGTTKYKGIYFDGELAVAGYDLSGHDLIDAMGLQRETRTVSEAFCDSLPKSLADLSPSPKLRRKPVSRKKTAKRKRT